MSLDKIRFAHLTKREAAEEVKNLIANSEDEKKIHLKTLRDWILKAHHLDLGIYHARIALADAER